MSKTLDDFDAVRTVVEALKNFDSSDQERIIRWAMEKLGLSSIATTLPRSQPPASTAHSSTPSGSAPATADASPSARGRTNIKDFVSRKKPKTDIQFAAAVAYYYRFEAPEHERKMTITPDDLQEACRLVDRDRLVKPSKTLGNAHSSGLLDRNEKGAYSINAVGENLVAMTLPADNASTPPARQRSRPNAARKNRSSKKGAKSSGNAKTKQRTKKS